MQSTVRTAGLESLKSQGFELWYQPAFNSSSGQVQHNEVLLRWRDSKGRLYLPKDFMPWVSKAQMKQNLDQLVIRRAIRKAASVPQAQLSINLSKESLESRTLTQYIFDEISRAGVSASTLKFEISEFQAAQNFKRTVEFIQELKQIGCSVILDNFSNDHLTFMQWEKLNVDAVKINSLLMSNRLNEQERFLLTKAITDASAEMGQESVAKSIDELVEPRIIEECDFGFAQGYQLKPPSKKLSLTSKVDILGITLDNWKQDEFLEQLDTGVIFTPSVDHIMQLRKDPEYRKAYNIADYKLCSSQVLLMASHILGDPIQEKISSAEIFTSFCQQRQHDNDISLFIVGEGYIPAVAAEKINHKANRDLVVGHYTPPSNFQGTEIESERMIRQINKSGANTLVLGLQSPIQEKWVYQYQERLKNIKIIFALGDGLAIEAGVEPRAPQSMSNYGVEWFFRLMHHPQHLWRRYLINDVPFLWLLAKEKMFN